MTKTIPLPLPLTGRRVFLFGKLAGMSHRDAQALIAEQGGACCERPDQAGDWIVAGEADLPRGGLPQVLPQLDDQARQAIDNGDAELITETELWHRLGLVENHSQIQRLYTPAMLAELVGQPVSQIRRWHHRGLLQAVREVRRLPYFDFGEVTTARRIAEWIAAGVSAQRIRRQLDELRKALPDVQRPLAELPIVLEGKRLLVRQAEGLATADGQLWFDFSDDNTAAPPRLSLADVREALTLPTVAEAPRVSPEELLKAAIDCEDEGQLPEAADLYRAALAAGGPSAEICFLLAELLYRQGDIAAARERYYMAIELDENYVEARANLGCVLAESGQPDLAIAAFTGALAYHADFADAHFHLARVLDDVGRRPEAEDHWRTFLNLAPESPWADEARARVET